MRILLHGDKAQHFYKYATKNDNYTFEDNKFKGIGGYFKEGNNLVAYDFTNGHEVFIENFSNVIEAIKYASGIIATTKEGLII